MSDNERPPRSNLQVLLGFLLGIVLSLLTLVFSIFIGFTIRAAQGWLFLGLDTFLVVLMGIVALRRTRESSYAVGVVIALSLTLLLNGTCAVMSLR